MDALAPVGSEAAESEDVEPRKRFMMLGGRRGGWKKSRLSRLPGTFVVMRRAGFSGGDGAQFASGTVAKFRLGERGKKDTRHAKQMQPKPNRYVCRHVQADREIGKIPHGKAKIGRGTSRQWLTDEQSVTCGAWREIGW